MSIQANANGAARDLGLYSGIDGVVRKLFKDSELVQDFNAITAAQAGIQSEEWFDVSAYSMVLSIIQHHSKSGFWFYLFVVFPQLKLTLRIDYDYYEGSMGDPDWENSIVASAVVESSSYGSFEYDPEQSAIRVSDKKSTAFFI